MPILADTVDGVIGVDTHRDTLAAAALTPVGGILAQTTTPTTTDGYQQLLDVARAHVPGRRCWAVEGAGSDGAGLTAFGHAHGERVVEAARPKRPASRTGAKTDPIDAVRAGRDAWLRSTWRYHAAVATVRRCGCCWPPDATPPPAVSPRSTSPEALIVGAPEELRGELRGTTTSVQITRCAGLRDRPARPLEHRMTVRVLRTTAGANPVPPSRDRRARRRTRHAGGRGRAMAGRSRRCWADHRRAGPGELVVCRPVALAKQRLRPWPGPARSRLRRGRSPAIG